MSILLLTASINAQLASPVHTKLIDTSERLRQYMNALKRYIIESDFDTFVFCENTGFKILVNDLVQLAKEYNKSIEFLSFVSDIELVKKYGKGYGEGEIIEYAMKNSYYLQDDNLCFFKITGRLFVENINKILKNNINNKNCFFTDGINSASVQTVFFKSQISFFKNNLLVVYKKVDDSNNLFLEYIYFEFLINKKTHGIFPFPFINGNSGSTGNPYITVRAYKEKAILNFMGYYTLNETFYTLKKVLKKVINKDSLDIKK
jgi:hypothetical protein